jgi:hypothetical protein
MTLSVDRWLNVTRTDPTTRHVVLFGFRAVESSGHHEAAAAPSLNIINPLTGEVETQQPAKLAKSTVVEVWMERLDPAFGEDFGWQRVEAMITGGDPATRPVVAGVGVGLTPVFPGVTPLQNRILTSVKNFESSTFLEAVGLLQIPDTLWEGDVKLPPEDGHRHRLVVAEFEEYLIDGAAPYGKVPTEKGRRIVYVEHIELTE